MHPIDENPRNVELAEKVKHAAQWLVEHQNADGGWAFSGLSDSTLPSDADDTALGTLALIRSHAVDTPVLDDAILRGIAWLKTQQSRDGSWSTYQPRPRRCRVRQYHRTCD